MLTLGTLGVLMLLGAGMWAWGASRFVGRALQTPGTVVRIHTEYTRRTDRKASSSGPSYCPVVRFTTANEKTVEFKGLGSSEADYEPGDEVTVLYLPDEPEKGKISSFQELWLGPVVFAVFGGICAGVALLMVKLKF